MKTNIPTPHINAPEGAFAETVLMPGDPLRSRYIAENFLENAELAFQSDCILRSVRSGSDTAKINAQCGNVRGCEQNHPAHQAEDKQQRNKAGFLRHFKNKNISLISV